MLSIKIGENTPINIDMFVETKDFVERPGITTLRIDFNSAYPFGDDTINALATMFREIPYLVILEDNEELLKINGKVTLYRITREARRRSIVTCVQLTYLPNDIIE